MNGEIMAGEQRVLKLLKEGPAAMVYLTTTLHLSPSSIRNNISQIRSLGYDVINQRGVYILMDTVSTNNVTKLWLEHWKIKDLES